VAIGRAIGDRGGCCLVKLHETVFVTIEMTKVMFCKVPVFL